MSPGTATLSASLVNDLSAVADELRGLYGEFGVDHWAVYRCVVTWTGGRRGEGTSTEVATQILPTPRVAWASGSGRLRYDMLPTGKDQTGEVLLTEVSLSYTEAELRTDAAAESQEVYYKITDAIGNGMAARYFIVSRPPAPDRESGIGWIVALRLRESP